MKNLKSIIKKCKKSIASLTTTLSILILTRGNVYAISSNTSSIDGFITFVCDWLLKIGGVAAMIGGVMFALGWQREDAEGKSRGLLTMMAGFMVMAIAKAPDLFGI